MYSSRYEIDQRSSTDSLFYFSFDMDIGNPRNRPQDLCDAPGSLCRTCNIDPCTFGHPHTFEDPYSNLAHAVFDSF